MSFRYTNNLVGAMKHRLLLEAAHRDLARRTFTGVCNGIVVTCSGYGTVLKIELLDKARWEPYYRPSSSPSASTAASLSRSVNSSTLATAAEEEGGVAENVNASSATPTSASDGIDLSALATSIRGATWDAVRKIRSAKREAHARSLQQNTQLKAHANLRHWYEEDPNTLQPRPMDAVKNELATPWMQAVRFGKPHLTSYLNQQRRHTTFTSGAEATSETTTPSTATPAPRGVCVLDPADCDPTAIPIASAHPLFTAGLIHLEAGDGDVTDGTGSRVNVLAVLSEQKKELNRDEQLFWDRVELIRAGQLAAIPRGEKRGYAEMSSTVVDNVAEKVQLRFTQ